MTNWRQIAQARWRGWSIEGDGPYAVVNGPLTYIRLFEFAMCAAQYLDERTDREYLKIVELKAIRKMNTQRRSTSDPSRQEKD
jgi:hypothetical protein